jgi:hypothetical protein
MLPARFFSAAHQPPPQQMSCTNNVPEVPVFFSFSFWWSIFVFSQIGNYTWKI